MFHNLFYVSEAKTKHCCWASKICPIPVPLCVHLPSDYHCVHMSPDICPLPFLYPLGISEHTSCWWDNSSSLILDTLGVFQVPLSMLPCYHNITIPKWWVSCISSCTFPVAGAESGIVSVSLALSWMLDKQNASVHSNRSKTGLKIHRSPTQIMDTLP